MNGEWQEFANCATTSPDVMFPEGKGTYNQARKICGACEVRTECLTESLANDDGWGMRGGATPAERARMRRDAA